MNCIKDSKFMKDYLAVRKLETVYYYNKKPNFNAITNVVVQVLSFNSNNISKLLAAKWLAAF